MYKNKIRRILMDNKIKVAQIGCRKNVSLYDEICI